MTALIVWGSIIAVLTLLLTLKVGVRASFGENFGGFNLWLVIGLFKRKLSFGGGEKPPKPEKEPIPEEAAQAEEDKLAETEEDEQAEPEQTESGEEKKPSFLDSFDKKKLIKTGVRILIASLKLPRIDVLTFHYTAGGKSADKTALAYGRMCAALGVLLPFLDRYMRVKRRRIITNVDFTREKAGYSGVVQITVTVGAVLGFGLWALVELLKCRTAKNITKENQNG